MVRNNINSGEFSMQHLVFGAGLIGGYLGAAIAANGQKVCLIGRATVLDKWQQGIRLTDYQGNQSGHTRAAERRTSK